MDSKSERLVFFTVGDHSDGGGGLGGGISRKSCSLLCDLVGKPLRADGGRAARRAVRQRGRGEGGQ